uniref:Uncharacterized protein n=1 Tax=Kalanchoe fedtschenkoi TaxID=63787 RepID=A0A7N0V600_KALFE
MTCVEEEFAEIKLLELRDYMLKHICLAPHTPSTESIEGSTRSANGIQGARHISAYTHLTTHHVYIHMHIHNSTHPRNCI